MFDPTIDTDTLPIQAIFIVKAQIAAIEYALPDRCVTNEELHRIHPEWPIDKLFQMTGVYQRYICDQDETALDLATTACRKLLDKGIVEKTQIGAVIVCSQSPDYIMPPNATLLHSRLELARSVAAFDYTLACSGYVYGLLMAKAFIESNLLDNIILVTADTYSKYIHPNDRSTVAIFGDGAAATLVRRGTTGIGEISVGTDGNGSNCIIIPAGGTRTPKSTQTSTETTDNSGNIRTLENISMNGLAVLRLVQQTVPANINGLLNNSGYTCDDISLFVFHQASSLALNYVEKFLQLPSEKVYRNLHRVGNTVSASIPIAIRDAELEGRIRPGSRLLLAGFGVGFSWGSCIVDW